MAYELTVVVHDWDGAEDAVELSRVLSGDWGGVKPRLVAVVSRSVLKGAGGLLADLGFETVAVENGAGAGSRKNAGLDACGGDVVLLTARARLASPSVLTALSAEAGSFPGAGVVGCTVVDPDGLVVSAGWHLLQPQCDPYPIEGAKRDIGQYHYSREVHGVDSSCMYLRREALDVTGGYEEEYDGRYGDIDLCLKFKAAGYRVVCAGKERVTVSRVPGADPGSGEGPPDAFRDRWGGAFPGRYETSVMWHSWINAPSGYAVSSQYLVLALESLGVDVRYGFVYGVEEAPNEDERIMEVRRKPKDLDITQVVYGQGDVFFKNSGRYRVGYSMLEVTGIPHDWVEQANALDEIWVPSRFNLESFSSSGVKKRIEVMPLGVDVQHFNPFIKAHRFDNRFVFLSVFEWGERKAPEILLKAFNQEFSASDDVALLLKVINTDPAVSIERKVESLRLRQEGAPVIIVQNHDVPSYQMGSLYCSCDCFVLPTRGEGWGMPTLEAMACGLPVISTGWSAQTEFLDDEVGYPIRVKSLIPAVAKCPYYAGYRWADPDFEHLRQLMRRVYENRDEARARGLRASIKARESWTWEDAAKRIRKRLMEIAG